MSEKKFGYSHWDRIEQNGIYTETKVFEGGKPLPPEKECLSDDYPNLPGERESADSYINDSSERIREEKNRKNHINTEREKTMGNKLRICKDKSKEKDDLDKRKKELDYKKKQMDYDRKIQNEKRYESHKAEMEEIHWPAKAEVEMKKAINLLSLPDDDLIKKAKIQQCKENLELLNLVRNISFNKAYSVKNIEKKVA